MNQENQNPQSENTSPQVLSKDQEIHKLVRISIVLAILGLSCTLLFLGSPFSPWSIGVGIFLGVPLLGLALVLYLLAVILDLKGQGVL